MERKDLFDLRKFDNAYKGYFFDRNLILWSSLSPTNGQPFRRLVNQRSYFNGSPYPRNLASLRAYAISKSSFIAFRDLKAEDRGFTDSSNKQLFVIGSIQGPNNVSVSFAAQPKIHESEESVRTETERLAIANPDKAFAYFELKGMCKVSRSTTWM
jgi:hypothetical protein